VFAGKDNNIFKCYLEVFLPCMNKIRKLNLAEILLILFFERTGLFIMSCCLNDKDSSSLENNRSIERTLGIMPM